MRIQCLAPFLLLTTAFAQSSADRRPALIEGKVVNSVTGAPLRKAEVRLADSPVSEQMAAAFANLPKDAHPPGDVTPPKKIYTSTTDASGAFRFENVASGTYWLTAKRTGFLDGNYESKDVTAESGLPVTAGQQLKELELRLTPVGAITGRVVDEDGDPLPDASIAALQLTYTMGRRKLMPVEMETTNDKGEFRLGKLPPGHYFLSARKESPMDPTEAVLPPPADGSPETGYVATYFPSAVEVTQASKVDIAPGSDMAGFTIHLQKSRVVRVKGILAGADGAPLKKAQLMLMQGDGGFEMSGMAEVDNPEGKFELVNVQPGSYTLMVTQMSGSAYNSFSLPLEVSDKNTEVKLAPLQGQNIAGKFLVDGDAKLALEGLSVSLTGSRSMMTMPVNAAASPSGDFTLKNVAPAAYDLMISPVPAGSYLKSVAFNGREMLGKDFDLSASAAGTLRIVLGTDGGKAEGAVTRDGKPAPNATVILLPAVPERRSPQTVCSSTSDAAGRLTVKDIPPGDYLAFAWEKLDDGAWADPEVIKPIESQGVRVTIGPGGNAQLQLKLIPAVK